MKKITLLLLLTFSLAFAKLEQIEISPNFLKKDITIIDIRTQGEWLHTGILKGSIPITFFDEQGQYDVPDFLSKLSKHVKQGETFALVCATGSRTNMLGNFLGQNGFNVINLNGGVDLAIRQGVQLVKYQR